MSTGAPFTHFRLSMAFVVLDVIWRLFSVLALAKLCFPFCTLVPSPCRAPPWYFGRLAGCLLAPKRVGRFGNRGGGHLKINSGEVQIRLDTSGKLDSSTESALLCDVVCNVRPGSDGNTSATKFLIVIPYSW